MVLEHQRRRQDQQMVVDVRPGDRSDATHMVLREAADHLDRNLRRCVLFDRERRDDVAADFRLARDRHANDFFRRSTILPTGTTPADVTSAVAAITAASVSLWMVPHPSPECPPLRTRTLATYVEISCAARASDPSALLTCRNEFRPPMRHHPIPCGLTIPTCWQRRYRAIPAFPRPLNSARTSARRTC
jgi:hypothetical protein